MTKAFDPSFQYKMQWDYMGEMLIKVVSYHAAEFITWENNLKKRKRSNYMQQIKWIFYLKKKSLPPLYGLFILI